MRYAIVSDIHANMQAWEAVLADIRLQGAEVIICLGDVVGYGPKPAEVLEAVRAETTNFVLGNHDAAAVGMMDYSIFNDHARQAIEWTMTELADDAKGFLAAVPLAIEAGDILFVHAEIAEPGRFDYIDSVEIAKENFGVKDHFVTFVGHTHLPKIFERSMRGTVTELKDHNVRLEEGNRYIVNVGSVGEPRNPEDLRARYVIYDAEDRVIDFRRVEFDIPRYRVDLESSNLALRPYFLRVYEQVVEGREVTVSQGGSLVDMRVAHDSAALVDLGKVSDVVRFNNPGEMLASAQPSKAPIVFMSVVGALVALGVILAVFIGRGKDEAGKEPVTVDATLEEKENQAEPPVPAGGPTGDKKAPDDPRVAMIGEPVKTVEPEIAKIEPDPKPAPPKPKPEPPKPKPEPVKPTDVFWWRMDGGTDGGVLVDVNGNLDLYPMKEGKEMKAIAPDPVPLNQKGNDGAMQIGIWQEEVSSDLFWMGPKQSFTFEGWVLSENIRQAVFLLGTRTGGPEDRRGWHIDLRQATLGRREGQMSFFYDNGEKRAVALAEAVIVANLKPHHFAVVWDHDAGRSNGEMRLFLDGKKVAEKKLAHSLLLKNQANPFRIGAEGNPEKMALDELRYSKRALEPHEFLVKKAVQGVTITKANPKSRDSWSVAGNWKGGKLPGKTDNVVIGKGLTVQVEKKPPAPYEGALVLKEKAKLLLWGNGSLTALPNVKSKLVMSTGARVVLRTGDAEFGPIDLEGSAEIRGGESTNGHNTRRRFKGEISGPGMLLLNGVNKNSFYLHVPNSFTGGTRAFSKQKQAFRISVKSNGAFGTGDVTIEENVTLKLGREMGAAGDAIADDATLFLNGKEGSESPKLKLEVNERVGALVIDGEDQGEGVFSSETHPLIGGKGKLTVKRKGR